MKKVKQIIAYGYFKFIINTYLFLLLVAFKNHIKEKGRSYIAIVILIYFVIHKRGLFYQVSSA